MPLDPARSRRVYDDAKGVSTADKGRRAYVMYNRGSALKTRNPRMSGKIK